jgi:ABC-type transport system involved in multi-copper enzyme maturation permease subunit
MTAGATADLAARDGVTRQFTGLRNAIRKDLREWRATPRAAGTLLGVITFSVMSTLGPWLGRAQGRRDPGVAIDATASFVAAGWLTLLPLVAAFATLAIVTVERDRGTLAWSLSKPLTRDAFLASKLITGIGMFVLLGIAVPMVPSFIAATIAYGSVPEPSSVALTFLGAAALSVFYIALQVTASVFAWSQAVAALVVLGSMLTAQALVAIEPRLYDVMPLSIADWIARLGRGEAQTPLTPVAFGVAVLVLLAAARWRFARTEL